MDRFWVVAKTKSSRERWAAENVARQGFEYYLPVMAKETKPTPRSPLKSQCLFPGYLFVLTEGRWRFLLGTFGVLGVIMQGSSSPAAMPSAEIERLRAREDVNGLIKLPELKQSRFNHGDSVRINGGTFSGFTGIFQQDDAHARVRVLLDFLGRKTPVLVGEEFLEAAE